MMLLAMLWRLQIKISVSSVTDVVKMNTAVIIPNAVGIFTADNKVRTQILTISWGLRTYCYNVDTVVLFT